MSLTRVDLNKIAQIVRDVIMAMDVPSKIEVEEIVDRKLEEKLDKKLDEKLASIKLNQKFIWERLPRIERLLTDRLDNHEERISSLESFAKFK